MKPLFWVSFFIVSYHFLIYPLFLWLLTMFKSRNVKRGDLLPYITLIVPVYNEERIILEKIENSLSLDYPKEKMQIIFASDGSTDRSTEIIKKYLDRGIELIEFSEHSGKADLLNKTVSEAKGEIVFFSDASGLLNREAIKEMVKNFSDPEVGCVCGVYRILKDKRLASDEFEARYLDFEFLIKFLESKIYTTLGGHGALYAIRKELFSPLEEDIINDDFFIPAHINLRGLRTVYEKKALVFDKIETDIKSELRRRIRLSVGGWQQIFRLAKLFSLNKPFIAWQFFSHKFLRLLMPFCFLFLILSSFFSYQLFFWLLFSFIFLSLIFFRKVFLIFFVGNLAGIIGAYKFFFKKGKVDW